MKQLFFHNFRLKQPLRLTTIKVHSVPVLLSSICSFFILSGCEPVKDNNSLSSSKSDQYCQSYDQPFGYNLCKVQQETLLEENNHLALALYWREKNDNTNKNAKPLFTFNNLQSQLPNNQSLIFATNAGMYNQEFAPIGYTVIDGKQILSLNLNEGAGNFHLMPNGVFWWDKHGFYITQSQTMSEMLQSGTQPKYASQSGPMLVINGEIHPKFKADSTSKKIRNGVGICKNGMIEFVTTNTVVNFHEFATLFQQTLECDNALFFDGGIASALYAPNLQRQDNKNMGVMLGLIETENK